MSAVGDVGKEPRRTVARRTRGGAYLGGAALGGGLGDVMRSARTVSKRYVRPMLDVIEEVAPAARGHVGRARRVLDAVGGAYLGGREGRRTVGSKEEVFHGVADHTAGGLSRRDLVKNKRGKIVSKKQQAAGRRALARLRDAGY